MARMVLQNCTLVLVVALAGLAARPAAAAPDAKGSRQAKGKPAKAAPPAREEPKPEPKTEPAEEPKDDAKEEAKRVYLEGKEAYGKGEFGEAALKWQRAYELTQTPELLFNIARAHEQAGNAADAITYYERYLKDSNEPRDRAVVEATIKRLQAQVGSVKKPDKPAEKPPEKTRDEEAAAHFKKGRELYQAGNYKDAVTELQTAFDMVPTSSLIYNIAKTREKMGDFAGALKDYRTYLKMEPNAPDKGDVEGLIKTLEKKSHGAVSELQLESTPPGADVFLDGSDKLSGQTPLALKVPAGEHAIKVQKNGFEPSSRTFAMPEDRDLSLTFDLRPLENVGYMSVECAQDGSHIFLDGTILALTPYKERRALEAGKHQIVLEHEGYQRFTQVVDVQKGKESHLKVDLQSSETRSRAPLVLAPLLGGVFALVALVGAVLSTGFAFQASRAIEGTPGFIAPLVGFGVGEGVAVAVGLAGLLVTTGIILLWIVLGLVGGSGGSEVTVRPVEGSTP